MKLNRKATTLPETRRFPILPALIAAAVLALLSPAQAQAQAQASAKAIRMAWFPLPPHVFAPSDGGPPTGPSIELLNEIAARMGYQVDWVGPIPLNRLGQEQKAGSMGLEGTILHIKTPAIVEFLLYPSRPYFVATPSLGLRADNPLRRIESFEDIEGYRIGFVKTLSSNYPPFIAEHRDRLVIDELSGEDWTARNLRKLLERRIDAVYERNQYTFLYEAARMGASDKVRELPLPAAPIEHFYVFHRNSPRARILLEAYERATADFAFDYDAMVEVVIARLASPAGGTGVR